MLNNITVDQDGFINIVKEEYELLITDAIKNSQLEFWSQLLYDEILEFSSIVQTLVRALKRRESNIKRICVTSNTEGKDKAKQISDLESHITELETMVNDLMIAIEY